MKKKIVTAILMLCMAFSLCACGGGNDGGSQDTEKENTQQESQKDEDSEAEESEEAPADGKVVYSVKLVDADGNPVAGQNVQVCNDSTCFTPQKTNEEGVAKFELAEAEGYKAKLLSAGDDAYVYFESGAKELTITVEAQ